jgi:hypothetical protein
MLNNTLYKKTGEKNMKKTMVSLVAAAALTTGAFAADKGIDIVTNGQAVVYYQTADTAANEGFFGSTSSRANVGIQLDLAADLKNNFTFGAQLTYLDALGLNNDNLVGDANVMQLAGNGININTNTTDADLTSSIALTKIFVAKKIANTTVKLGRQELPKSLSPLAFSESWNVFKNTFEAAVVVNTDIPDTTVVAAYVGGGNGNGVGSNLGTMGDLANGLVQDGAYMIAAVTTAIPMTTLTANYYTLHDVDSDLDLTTANDGIEVDALWADAQIAPKDAPMGIKVGLQYGNIDPDAAVKDTTAWGIKVSAKPMETLTVCAAYTDVDDGYLPVVNYGTLNKTPLYTQMISTEASISSDADAMMLKASYSLGDMGTLTAQYASVDDTSAAAQDLNELDVIYTVKAGGVDYLAAYVMKDFDNEAGTVVDTDIIRLWARYNF